MTTMKHTLEQVIAGQSLSKEQAQDFFSEVVKGQVDNIILSAMLTALKIKGETPQEISGAAAALRDNCVPFPAIQGDCADNCGTGGDGSNTFNISTTASIIAAACGLPIVKHGNRSVSSKSGSADMLERFGVNLQMSPAQAKHCLDQTNLTFLFAPHYHAGIKHAMPVRQTLQTRTLFNILGPLVNPAKPSIQLLGVYHQDLCRPMAEALKLLGTKRAMVVNGSGMDEIALHGPTTVVELNNGELSEYVLTPEDFALQGCDVAALVGGEPEFNANITAELLSGRGTQAQQSAIAVNVAALLLLFGKVSDLKQGAAMALEVMASGKAKETFDTFAALSQQNDQ